MDKILIEEAKQIMTDVTPYIEGEISLEEFRKRLINNCLPFEVYGMQKPVFLMLMIGVFLLMVLSVLHVLVFQ